MRAADGVPSTLRQALPSGAAGRGEAPADQGAVPLRRLPAGASGSTHKCSKNAHRIVVKCRIRCAAKRYMNWQNCHLVCKKSKSAIKHLRDIDTIGVTRAPRPATASRTAPLAAAGAPTSWCTGRTTSAVRFGGRAPRRSACAMWYRFHYCMAATVGVLRQAMVEMTRPRVCGSARCGCCFVRWGHCHVWGS